MLKIGELWGNNKNYYNVYNYDLPPLDHTGLNWFMQQDYRIISHPRGKKYIVLLEFNELVTYGDSMDLINVPDSDYYIAIDYDSYHVLRLSRAMVEDCM